MIYIGIISILIIVGYGFSLFLLPSKLNPYSLLVAPWFGFLAIVILGLAINLGKVSLHENIVMNISGSMFIVIFTLVFLTYMLLQNIKIVLNFNKSALLLSVSPLIALFLYSVIQPADTSVLKVVETINNAPLIDHVRSALEISNVTLNMGFPLVLSFFSSFYTAVSLEHLSRIVVAVSISLILPLIFFSYIIYRDKLYRELFIPNNRKLFLGINNINLLIALVLIGLSTYNLDLLIIAISIFLVAALYYSVSERNLSPLINVFKSFLLSIVINPIWYGFIFKVIFRV